jgi:phenylacetate-CoA ligase
MSTKKSNKSIINPFLSTLTGDQGLGRIENVVDYSNISLRKIHSNLLKAPAQSWEEKGHKMAIALFRKASRRVPAYKDFLKRNAIKPEKVRTVSDLAQVPWMDKNNYFRFYPLDALCWDGLLSKNTLFSVSSGSTGTPFLWPRGNNLEIETSINHGLILSEFFKCDDRKTLFIDTFSMGIYIAGVVILNSALRFSEKGAPLTIITPGVEINDILRVFSELAQYYDQTIIAGYPPFVRDIIMTGLKRGIKWKKSKIKFLFAAENFSEDFREFLIKKAGISAREVDSSFNIYGSAEASIMGHETPLTVAIRKAALRNDKLFKRLFSGHPFLPTFVQYNPALKFFEQSYDELLLTAYAGIPLIRYNIHDEGKITTFSEMLEMLESTGGKKLAGRMSQSWKLPFLSIVGKSDKTISFYGVKIYAENIKAGLESKEIQNLITGKFFMFQKKGVQQDQLWELHIELEEAKRDNSANRTKINKLMLKRLIMSNSEYGRLHRALGKRAEPAIVFHTKGDSPKFAQRLIKQRWLSSE